MRRCRSAFVGHIQSSVGEVVLNFARALQQERFVLITSVDSQHNLKACVDVCALDPSAIYIEGGMLTSPQVLVRAAEAGTLNGFDEVWVVSKRPASRPSAAAILVCPRDLDRDDAEQAVDWFEANGGVLAIGDGDGLNFIANSEDLALKIEKNSR